MKIPCWIETHRRLKLRMARRIVSLPEKRWTRRIFDWHPSLDNSIKTRRQVGRGDPKEDGRTTSTNSKRRTNQRKKQSMTSRTTIVGWWRGKNIKNGKKKKKSVWRFGSKFLDRKAERIGQSDLPQTIPLRFFLRLDVLCTLLCSDLLPRDRATPRCKPYSSSTSATRAATGRTEVDNYEEIQIQNQYCINNNTLVGQYELLWRREPDRSDDITRDEATEHNATIEELEEETTVIEQLVSTKMYSTLRKTIMDASTFQYDAVVTVPAYFNYSQCQTTEDDGTTAGLCVLNTMDESPLNYSCKIDEDAGSIAG